MLLIAAGSMIPNDLDDQVKEGLPPVVSGFIQLVLNMKPVVGMTGL